MGDIRRLIDETAQVVCDRICRYPYELSQSDLDKKCNDCPFDMKINALAAELEAMDDDRK